MDARRRTELLAPQADRAEQQDHRVQRVLALPRVRRRVGLQPAEDDVDVLRGERMALDVGAVARVVHERGVDAGEQAVLDHDRLAAAVLLGRRAEEHDLARELVGDGRQGDRRPDPGRRHRVVPAAVAKARQGVVLGEDPDPRSVRARARPPWSRGWPSPADPAGCSTANPWSRSASATQVAAWTSSNAGSGLAWIRWDRPTISSRAASTACGDPRLGVGVGLGRDGGDQVRHARLRDGPGMGGWMVSRIVPARGRIVSARRRASPPRPRPGPR